MAGNFNGALFLIANKFDGYEVYYLKEVIESNSIYVPNPKCTKYFGALVKNLPKTMTTIFILIGN